MNQGNQIQPNSIRNFKHLPRTKRSYGLELE